MKQAAATRAQFRYNKKQVLFLTRMTEDQYSNFQIDTAKAWVECFWSTIMEADKLLNTTLFWQWWMYEWNCTDNRRIISALYAAPKNKRLTLYRQLHQYVFDSEQKPQKEMMKDFREMKPKFEREIKQPKLL